MRAVVQRVAQARVEIEGEVTGEIGRGLLVLLGVELGDAQGDLDYICRKVEGLRVFNDAGGVMNLSLAEAEGELLLVSQFTLLGDVRHGRRPSYSRAASPEEGNAWYEKAIETFRAMGIQTQTGRFGADMRVHLVNEGPVTILLDSRKIL